MPNILVEDADYVRRIPRYAATFQLPPEAKHLVDSSVEPVRTEVRNGRILCHFDRKNADPTPIHVRWTDYDVNLDLTKSARMLPGSVANIYSLRNDSERMTVQSFAMAALLEKVQHKGQTFTTFYSGPDLADRYVEATAWYVERHMRYVEDGGSFGGAQSAFRTLTGTAYRGPGDFNGDCEDHAILRAALLRALGFSKDCIFCADQHNSYGQGQADECRGEKKNSGGHTYNLLIYKGKYWIMDFGEMFPRTWGNKSAWIQHVTDNIWNDHTGKHWSQKDVTPFGRPHPMVNYPGNPCSPTSTWDWRTYFNDVTL